MHKALRLEKLCLLTLITLLCLNSPLYSLPEDENVIEGTAIFDRSEPNVLKINTNSDKLIVEYNSFSIATNESVYFTQPSISSSVLNRVIGFNISDIAGSLNANGIIYLINPNGINIGSTAKIDAAGLVVSTLNISNADFLNGKYNFLKSGKSAFILNQGNIVIRNGGYVCLLSQAVENQGTILANLGTVVVASGQKMTLALDDLNQISVVIDEAVKEAVFGTDGEKIVSAVKNSGTITANGGKVILTANVLNNIFDYAINNSGVIEAKSVVNHNGVVELVAEGAPIINTGKIEASEVNVISDSDFINVGDIITDGYEVLPDGGRVSIEAGTILQQGLISANADENGTAGEVNIVSQTSTVLDDGSSTEARALGIIGNGGRVLINSTGGNTIVNTNAVIDVSAGAISGNAGFIEVSAFEQLGFYGVLNGRAPPGYYEAIVMFDGILISKGTVTTITIDSPTTVNPAYVKSGDILSIVYTITLNKVYATDESVTVNIQVRAPVIIDLTLTVIVPAGSKSQQFTTEIEIPLVNTEKAYHLWVQAKHPTTKITWDKTEKQNTAVVVDNTPPSITASRDPLANSYGWNNKTVTVSYAVSDALSGVDTSLAAGYADDVLSSEGAGQSASGIVYDKAGNSASVTVNGINIDKTAPIVDITAPTNGVTYDTAQTLLYTTPDNLDPNPVIVGPASGTVYNTLGTHSITVTATDLAGNNSSSALSFTIEMPTFTKSQLSNATILRFLLPGLAQLGQYQINTFIPVGGPVYLYHPITRTDMSAFEELERGR